MVSQLGPAIDVRSTFRNERELLIQLLRKLDEPEWTEDTVCPGWSVRDVAAHLLHDDLRRLSRSRDHVEGSAPDAGESLPTFLNRANDRWVEETRFLGPQLLVDLLTHTAHLLHRMWTGANLDQLGEGVWWAGVEAAPVWLDVARDSAKTGFTTSRSATPSKTARTQLARIPRSFARHLDARPSQDL
jgi:uncharacterized protein (TIGR03083 family)